MRAVQTCFTLRHTISYAVSWKDCDIEMTLVLTSNDFCVTVKVLESFLGGKNSQEGRKVKPIGMCIKGGGFQAMSSSQWYATQLLCSLLHVSSDLELLSSTSYFVNIYLSLIPWMSYGSIKIKLKLDLGHGRVIPTERRATPYLAEYKHTVQGWVPPAPSARWLSRKIEQVTGAIQVCFRKWKSHLHVSRRRYINSLILKNIVNMKWL